MFDCLDTFVTHAHKPTPTRAISPNTLARRHAGQNWVRFSARRGDTKTLGGVSEAAASLNAQVVTLSDGSIALLGLNLSQILTLSARFGTVLAVEAHIAAAGVH